MNGLALSEVIFTGCFTGGKRGLELLVLCVIHKNYWHGRHGPVIITVSNLLLSNQLEWVFFFTWLALKRRFLLFSFFFFFLPGTYIYMFGECKWLIQPNVLKSVQLITLSGSCDAAAIKSLGASVPLKVLSFFPPTGLGYYSKWMITLLFTFSLWGSMIFLPETQVVIQGEVSLKLNLAKVD